MVKGTESMEITSYVAVFSAVLLPAIIYFVQAYREQKNVLDIRDFFPLKRTISTGEYRSTTIAAGMSLATVIIAFINLAPLMGLTLFVPVVSYSISFLILYICVPRIMEANPTNDTIQAYLGKSYSSSSVKYIALFFSIIGYISIFSMELLVGVTVLQPFLGERVLIFAFLYLIFIIIYSLISGYRAIIATDRWQLRFILIGLFSMLLLAIIHTNSASDVNVYDILSSVSKSWIPAWPFIIGITVMNLPAPISDAGTWQRLCSTRDVISAKRGLLQIAPFFAILWAFLVLFACYYWRVVASQGFDASQEFLITYIMKTLATSGPLFTVLLFLFVLGLFSAMISTADSLLVVAGQIFSIDIIKLRPDSAKPQAVMRKARAAMGLIALVSFVIFTILHFLKFDVVQLVFAIYGAQLSMFPAVFFSLFFKKWIDLSQAKFAAGASILIGFLGGWSSALFGKFSGASNWLYNAPVTALVAGMVTFIILALPALAAKRETK
jgi:Na+/proline symporter